MSTPFDLLPVELQSIVLDMRAAHVDAPLIDTAIDRMLSALSQKSNKVQVQIWEIEEHLGQQLTQIGDKLQADLQTQHGSTNAMLSDALNGIAEIKKNWDELEQWRGRVERVLLAFSEFRGESTTDRRELRAVVAQQDARHGRQIAEVIARLEAIEQLLTTAGVHHQDEHNRHEAGS